MTFCEFIGFANVNQNHAFFHHLFGHIRSYLVVGRMHVSKRLGGLRIHGFLGAGNAHRKDRGHHGGKADTHQIHFVYLQIDCLYANACLASCRDFLIVRKESQYVFCSICFKQVTKQLMRNSAVRGVQPDCYG